MIKYDIYSPVKYLDKVVELEAILWKNKNKKEIRRIFEWKYPYNVNLYNGFVALDGECIVGFRGFFIQNYIKEGRIFPVAVLSDAVVHPDYQRCGIFSELTTMAINYYRTTSLNYLLALSANPKSSRGDVKMGLQPFLRKEYRIGVSILNIFCGHLKSSSKVSDYEIEKVNFADIDKLAHELDSFCRTVDGTQGVSLRRDYYYWTWRFANPNWGNDVEMAVMRKNGIICGICVFLHENRKGVNIIRIMDIVVADISLYPILYKGLKKMTNAWCYFILSASGIPKVMLRHLFPFSRHSNTSTPADFYLIKSLNDNSIIEFGNDLVLNYSNID